MGGAGTWHIGLHHPDEWVAIEAGAGFTETRTYAKLPPTTPEYELRALHIYDAADYAENAANVPTVGYGGEIDPAACRESAHSEVHRWYAEREVAIPHRTEDGTPVASRKPEGVGRFHRCRRRAGTPHCPIASTS